LVRLGPLEHFEERFAALNDDDCLRQEWMITAGLKLTRPAATGWSGYWCGRATSTVDASDLLQAAEVIGQRIVKLRIAGKWLGLLDHHKRLVGPVGLNLFRGTCGIAYFLDRLAQDTGDHTFRRVADEVLEQILGASEEQWVDAGKLREGVLDGPFGVVYALWNMGSWRGSRDMQELALERCFRLLSPPADGSSWDYVGGIASIICLCSQVQSARPDERLHQFISVAAEWLLRSLPEPRLGFAHGYSGAAVALFRAGTVLRKEPLLARAVQLITAEDTLFSRPGEKGGGEAAEDPSDHHLSLLFGAAKHQSWCNGFIGTLMARCILRERLTEHQIGLAMTMAADSTAALAAEGDSVCHGLTGNLEVLRTALGVFPQGGDAKATVAEATTAWADRARRLHVRVSNGMYGGVMECGFMIGLSGVGYGLLQALHAQRGKSIPSLIGLELSPPLHDLSSSGSKDA
jgi:lantibiotic modifying enzyme